MTMGTTTEPESPDYAAMAEAGATKAEIHAALEAHCAAMNRYYASLPDGKAQRDADIAASLATLRSETAEIRRLAREEDGPPDEQGIEVSCLRLAAVLDAVDAAGVIAAAAGDG